MSARYVGLLLQKAKSPVNIGAPDGISDMPNQMEIASVTIWYPFAALLPEFVDIAAFDHRTLFLDNS